MHQTFYIDPEEEISSVIDRLNKSMSTDNYFVVPKRALFLQSIVNLKLLKREGDKVGKHVVIVTQDEVGSSMAQRSGIEVRSSLDGVDAAVSIDEESADDDIIHEIPKIAPRVQQKKEIRLSGVGSNDFYDTKNENSDIILKQSTSVEIKNNEAHGSSISKKVVRRPETLGKKTLQPILNSPIRPRDAVEKKTEAATGIIYKKNLDSKKEKSLERIYTSKSEDVIVSSEQLTGNSNKVRSIFVGFILLCLLSFIGVAAYLFLPTAKITIESNIIKDKLSVDVYGGDAPVDSNKPVVQIRMIDKEESVMLPYEVNGTSTVAGKKAHGSIVIYNEYDSSPQTLIATTRLEAADGKIFRISKNVVVPGMTTVAGENKAGAISVDIVADQPGADYNIEPTTFTIPGFKDGPKYVKFSAKSTEAFTGGSTDNALANGTITQRDIDIAKQKTEEAAKVKIAQSVKDELISGEILLEQAEKITIVKSSAAIKVGDMSNSFNYTVLISMRALVFSENDIKSIIKQVLSDKQSTQDNIQDISKIEYGAADVDFDKNSMELKVYSEITNTPIIDKEKIKQELLGKDDDQLSSILMKYSSIKNVNVEFWPTIVTRIPQYDQRVSVEIKNSLN